jgi:8-oxo-dGTP pyrophosphatase MutT (NUDIX family)
MLRFTENGEVVAPRDASTLVLVRDGVSGLEVFCVERHKASAFMGGAIVFPGGKLDADDRDPGWVTRATAPVAAPFAPDAETARALAITACRETLEEATMLPTLPPIDHDALLALRKRVSSKAETLRASLAERGLVLDLARLTPFCRWITPERETRRFDTRFYLALGAPGDRGAHDEHETTASFWARPADVLARFDRSLVQVLPPTHRTLAWLASAATAEAAVEMARAASKDPICPQLVRQLEGDGETLALALPGDPAHPVKSARTPGPSRFVLRGERWLPEAAP